MTASTHTPGRLVQALVLVLVAVTVATAPAAAAAGPQERSTADLIRAQEQARLSTLKTASRADALSTADRIVIQESGRRSGRETASVPVPVAIAELQGFDWADAGIGAGAVLGLLGLVVAAAKATGRRGRPIGA